MTVQEINNVLTRVNNEHPNVIASADGDTRLYVGNKNKYVLAFCLFDVNWDWTKEEAYELLTKYARRVE